MQQEPLSKEAIFLAISFLLIAYLTYRCWTPPTSAQPSQNKNLPRDTVGPGAGAIRVRRFIPLALWFLHILLTLLYPHPPMLLCPCRDNLSRSLFMWSAYTKTVLLIIATTAPIRLLAFKQLGSNFTFRLAMPQELVTTGMYAYVQHPSYTANWFVLTTNVALLLRLDGVFGCVLPTWAVEWGMGSESVWIWPLLLSMIGLFALYATWIRVIDEEAMLKTTFGKAWESYHQRTKRFIPGIF